MEYKIAELTENILENYSEFYKTLSNLSPSPEISSERGKEILKIINGQNSSIYVAILPEKGEIVGSSTILIEQKFIRGGAKAGHVEDVVTRKEYEGNSIGKNLINKCIDRAREKGCYKITLDCDYDLDDFYSNKGEFYKNGICMRRDLPYEITESPFIKKNNIKTKLAELS